MAGAAPAVPSIIPRLPTSRGTRRLKRYVYTGPGASTGGSPNPYSRPDARFVPHARHELVRFVSETTKVDLGNG